MLGYVPGQLFARQHAGDAAPEAGSVGEVVTATAEENGGDGLFDDESDAVTVAARGHVELVLEVDRVAE